MKRFTVIVAMLALMLAAATANAGVFTDPDSGADVTSYTMRGFAVQAGNLSREAALTSSAFTGTTAFTQRQNANYNMTATGVMYNGTGVHPFTPANFNAELNTTATKNNTFTLQGNGIDNSANYGSLYKGFKIQKTVDSKLFFGAGSKAVANVTVNALNATATMVALAQTKNVTINRMVGNWKLFGFFTGNNASGQVGQYLMGDLIVNSSASQFGNATLYYKTAFDNQGWTAGATLDTFTLAVNNGLLSSAAGTYNYFTNAIMDATGNTVISAGNTTLNLVGSKSLNASGMVIAIRAASDGSAGFSTLLPKKYTVLGAGYTSMHNNSGAAIAPYNGMGAALYGTLDMNDQYHFNTGTSNVTMFNQTVQFLGAAGTGNGSIEYGSIAVKANPMAAMNFVSSRGAAGVISGSNFTGAMRVDGNLYAGIIRSGHTGFLTVIIPESTDSVVNLSSLSGDFINDAQFLAATGLNQCPRANASMGGKCFELSHAEYPTSGANARQVADITVSTYVASVIGAADNATIMNSLLFNKTAKADSADYVGNFTSEEYKGAPTKLTSMYAFNGTSFQLVNNASNDVQLLAKWVFMANGSGAIGNVNGLTVEEADPWKFMKKYTDVKNATAYTKVYGNATLQNWSKFWDADGNAATLTDGAVFYTQFGTNSSLLKPLQKTDTFASGTKYVLWAVLANGGLFDLDNSTDFVFDPPRIVTDETIVVSSSSSSGCVFNPVAGFGLEWLLLLLAPAVGIIRNRFRK